MKKQTTPYWTRVIAEAKKRKKAGKLAFIPAQLKRSGPWTTCACGKQDPRIPRSGNGVPDDVLLFTLGSRFYDSVIGDDPYAAESILHQIERRSAEILRGL